MFEEFETPEQLEREVMAHRYLYYVEAMHVLPDLIYDVLERKARAVCPPESPVHGVGSCLPSSYSADIIDYALKKIRR